MLLRGRSERSRAGHGGSCSPPARGGADAGSSYTGAARLSERAVGAGGRESERAPPPGRCSPITAHHRRPGAGIDPSRQPLRRGGLSFVLSGLAAAPVPHSQRASVLLASCTSVAGFPAEQTYRTREGCLRDRPFPLRARAAAQASLRRGPRSPPPAGGSPGHPQHTDRR